MVDRNPAFDATRWVFEVRHQSGDEIQVTHVGNGSIDIEIEEPWAGSTESGFGATCSATLTREAAESLRDWLVAALGAKS